VEKVLIRTRGIPRDSDRQDTVSGLPSHVDLSPNASVERRFVFVVKNDKVYRITLDWFRAQRENTLRLRQGVELNQNQVAQETSHMDPKLVQRLSLSTVIAS